MKASLRAKNRKYFRSAWQTQRRLEKLRYLKERRQREREMVKA